MNFILRTMIKNQLKGVPDEQIDMIIAAIEKDPAFFQRVAEEIKAKIDSGVSQEQAAQDILAKHGEEMKKLLGK